VSDEEASGSPAADSGDGAKSTDGGAHQDAKQDPRQPDPKQDGEPDEADRLRNATRSPLAGDAPPGAESAARFARSSGRRNLDVGRDSHIYERDVYQSGDTYNQMQLRSTPPVLAGPVPTEQLARHREVYREIPAYAAISAALDLTRLVVLCGDPGSGRLSTALALLSAVASDRVARLDPGQDLSVIEGADIDEGFGYIAEPAPAGAVALPADIHLDRLSSMLDKRKAYGVVLISDEDTADRLIRGRYGHRCLPPPAAEVLASHLRALLPQASPETRKAVAAVADRPGVRNALGLAELRPQEAFRLAGLLARHHTGELDDDTLLAECATFAPYQVQAWFAGLDREQELPQALPGLRVAAFRIALAVFNGTSYSVVAEAAELLAHVLARTLVPDPEKEPGRPLFADDPTTRLVAARAELRQGEEEISGVRVPVREIRFQGDALPFTVLHYVWNRYHNVRAPMVRWLCDLGRDPRPVVWVRAALAAGLLVGLDPTYGVANLIYPMAVADDGRRQMFAATALDQAARDERVAPAIRSLVRSWGRDADEELRWTAAAVHSYGTVAGSVAGSLSEIARIGTTDDMDLYAMAGYATVQLLGSADPGEVLDRIGTWLEDDRRQRIDLGLLAVVRIAGTRTGALAAEDWKPEGDVESGLSESARTWPVAITLAEVDELWGTKVAALIRRALDTARSREATVSATTAWIREARSNARLLAALERFLPRLVDGQDDLDLLFHLLDEEVNDPDDPLPRPMARRLWRAVQTAADPGAVA
jgi:hypothetical protein